MKVKEKNLVKASKIILYTQEKGLVAIWDSEFFFVITDDGFSLISGFTKILCFPENPLFVSILLVFWYMQHLSVEYIFLQITCMTPILLPPHSTSVDCCTVEN